MHMTPGQVWRAPVPAAGAALCVILDVARPGLLSFEASTRPGSSASARLTFSDPVQPAGGSQILVRRISHIVTLVTPGRHRFCAGPENPWAENSWAEDARAELEDLELRTGFLAFELWKNENPDDNGGHGEDPREIEIEPDGLDSPQPALYRALDELCRRWREQAGDDHGDSFLCVTPVPALSADKPVELAGELRHILGRDRDVYAFSVVEIQTIRVETLGEIDTHGGLYDDRGYRLAGAEEGGAGDNFRFVKTLLPGRYFVHVESARYDEGPYRLRLGVVP